MKVTFDWLQDHLKTNLKEKHLLEQLTNVGLEVESVESLSADNELFKVAKIIKIEKSEISIFFIITLKMVTKLVLLILHIKLEV